MTSTTGPRPTRPTAAVPSLVVAGALVDALAIRDLDAVAATMSPDVRFRALLPRRVLEVEGTDAVRGAFEMWFGDCGRWDMVEAVVGEVGARLHLRWRVRATKPGVDGDLVVEQQVYADADAGGLLGDVALMCTGFRPDLP